MPNLLPTPLLPIACLPDIEYFSWLVHASQAVLEVQETYPKQTCRNRYRISTANGPLTLTFPVGKPGGNHTRTSNVLLDLSGNWTRIHWRTIESAYSKSPFFLYYRDDFESIFENPPELLVDFNLTLLNLCCKQMEFVPDYKFSESFEKSPVDLFDLRQMIMPKHPIAHPYSIRYFEPYIQVFSDRHTFIPNLSILDLLFNLGPDAGDYLKRHVPGK